MISGARTEHSMRVVLGRFAGRKVTVRILKALFLLYCEKAPFIQLTWPVPLRAWQKLEGSTGVVVEKTQ